MRLDIDYDQNLYSESIIGIVLFILDPPARDILLAV